MPRPRARHVLHVVALVAGAAGLTLLLDQLGWGGIAEAIAETGPWFAVIAVIDLMSVMCDAGGIYRLVTPHARIRYARVFAAQASGLAINRLTPGNSFGEPIKMTMLMAHVPEAVAVSSVLMFQFASYIVAMTVIVIGVPLTLVTFEMPRQVTMAVLLATGVLLLGIVGLWVLRKRGAVATMIRGIRRLRLLSAERAARWIVRVTPIDDNLARFGDIHTRRALVFVVASRLLNMTGTVVILIAANIPITAPLLIGLLSVGILITWLSNVIPLGLGLADGSNYILYKVLGAVPELGIQFTMINRVRTVLLASMGLAIMAITSVVDGARRPAQ